MKKLFMIVLMVLLSVSLAQAETWKEFDNKTYVGGYYAAVCHFCLDGTYNDGDKRYWRCDNSEKPYTQGCAQGILNAVLGRVEVTLNR